MTPADLRVWQGKDAAAASKWASDEVMRRTVGDIINKNIKEIRAATAANRQIVFERQVVGHKTGEGWVTTYGPKATRGAWYDENLRGATVVIRPRPGHTPTAADPDGWYVHTAFPELVR